MKKLLSMSLAIVMATATLAGCGDSKTTTGNDTQKNTEAVETPAEDNVSDESSTGLNFKDKNIVYTGEFGKIVENTDEIKFFWKGDNSYSPNEDTYLFKWFEEETGVKLVPTGNPNAESRTDINLHATERFPSDIIMSAHDYDLMDSFATQGAFVNLADYFDVMPNTKRFFEETEIGRQVFDAMTTQNGELFLIPGVEEFKITHIPFVRKDWLDKVGMDVPQTTEDFEKMLYAFRDAELGADGITIPLVAKDWILYQNLPVLWGAQTYSRANGNMVLSYDKEKMYHGWITDEFRNATTQMSKWYDDGIFSRELFTEDDPKNLYFPSDRGGATYDSASRISFNTQPNMPEGFELLPILVPEYDGVRLDQRATHFIRRGRIGISAATSNLELALATLDAMMTETFIIANGFGIEGVHINLVDEVDGIKIYQDTKELAELALNEFDNNLIKAKQSLGIEFLTVSVDALGNVKRIEYDKEYGKSPIDDITNMYDEVIEKDFNNYEKGEVLFIPSPVITFTEEEQTEVNQIVTNLDFYLKEAFTKAITGKYTDLDDKWWDDYLNQTDKLGVKRLEEIYNEAYNR